MSKYVLSIEHFYRIKHSSTSASRRTQSASTMRFIAKSIAAPYFFGSRHSPGQVDPKKYQNFNPTTGGKIPDDLAMSGPRSDALSLSDLGKTKICYPTHNASRTPPPRVGHGSAGSRTQRSRNVARDCNFCRAIALGELPRFSKPLKIMETLILQRITKIGINFSRTIMIFFKKSIIIKTLL